MKATWFQLLALGSSLACSLFARNVDAETVGETRPASPPTAHVPSLVVWVTVDQLPAEILASFLPRFEPGGFRQLAEQGVYYRRATYQHAVTFTATGHATLFTGKHPSEHGIIANEWADRTNGLPMACVGDTDSPLVGDPPRPGQGTSPRNMLRPTVGDLLVMASGGASRVFSVSFKDRGAVLPGGQSGKAFWFSTTSGRFVSSTFYYPQLPAWAAAWNELRLVEGFRGGTWPLVMERQRYQRADADDRPFERNLYELGRVFPHPLPGAGAKDLPAAVACTPFGDELTISFALDLLDREKLGRSNHPDLLAISLSSTDMIGHIYGPDSLEAEDNLFRLDRLLARFLGDLRKRLSEESLLVVLSSDHGMGRIPEAVAATHAQPPSATGRDALAPAQECESGRHDTGEILAGAEDALKRQFDLKEKVLSAFWTPWIYLNESAVLKQGKSVASVEHALAELVGALPGVHSAWTRSDLSQGRVPDGALGVLVRNAFYAERAGHVLVLPQPCWYLYTESQKYAATHGTHYEYDRTVPILVMGSSVKPATVGREVHPEALADAVGRILGIAGPGCDPRDRLTEVTTSGPRLP